MKGIYVDLKKKAQDESKPQNKEKGVSLTG